MKTEKRVMAVLPVFLAVTLVSGGCAAEREAAAEPAVPYEASEETGAPEGEASEVPEPGERAAQGKTGTENPLRGVEDWRREHESVKGIYVTGPMAGSASMDGLISMVDETELNAMVIDIKNDEGDLTCEMGLDSAEELGACAGYIADIEGLMAKLKDHDIYTIARIVCFKDPHLAAGRQELALRKPDGTLVADAGGLAFVNPCRREVWEYIVDVAVGAARLGFDEVQFDYVRFPVGEDADAADYGEGVKETKEQTITEFLTYAADRLHGEGIVLGADIFGTIIGSETDAGRVGQDYPSVASVVDVVCPMVYPSHYAAGSFGLDVPDAHPYETIRGALEWSVRELQSVDPGRRAVVRPWLQSFTATWVPGHIPYGEKEIREQIRAVYDAGYEEWILWNASNRYPAEAL